MNDRRNFLQQASVATLSLAIPGLTLPCLARAADKNAKPLPYIPVEQIPNHRQLMREVVIALADYCRKRNPNFIIVARNAPELLIKEQREADWEAARDPQGWAADRYGPMGTVDSAYLKAIDGMLIDSLSYGHDHYDQPTRASDAALLRAAADVIASGGRRGLLIEYCKDPKHRAEAAQTALKAHLLPYFDGEGDKSLSHIPAGPPAGENPLHVTQLAKVQNFLPLMSSAGFARRDQWINAILDTNYDLLLVDPFFRGDSLTIQDVKALKFKRLGSQRLFLAPLPVGIATPDRFYWQKGWAAGSPEFLAANDPDQTGRFFTYYWTNAWKQVLGKYVTGLCDLGIDGVVLDGIDAYEYFEAQMPF